MNRGGIFARARLWCLAALSGVVAWMPVELQALPPQVEGKATASPLSVFTIPILFLSSLAIMIVAISISGLIKVLKQMALMIPKLGARGKI